MIGWRPGEYITEDGVYPSIPISLYHGRLTETHSTSHSALERLFRQSPAHYWDRSPYNPEAEPDEPNEGMILGRAAHMVFLGERGFQKQFVRRPDRVAGEPWQGNRTVCREWLADQQRKGLTVLTKEQVEKITGMGKSLAREPLVQSGIISGRIEQSIIVRDAETGIWIKTRPDAVPSDPDFVDLKTIADISDEGITKAISTLGYHRQGALILEAAERALGFPFETMTFTIVFIETKRPYCVEIVTLKPDDLRAGREQNRWALKLLRRCLDENDWPGPSGRQSDARYLGVRSYQRNAEDNRVAQIMAMLSVGNTTTAISDQA